MSVTIYTTRTGYTFINTRLKICIKYKNKLYKKTLTNNSQALHARYIRVKRTLQKQIKEAEANYYSDLLNSRQNSSRQTWQLFDGNFKYKESEVLCNQ